MREDLQKILFSLPAHYDAAIEWEGCQSSWNKQLIFEMGVDDIILDPCLF